MKKLIYILIAVFAVTVACESDEVTINTIDASEAELISAELDMPATNTFEITRTTDLVQGNEAADAVTFTWSKASGDNDGAIMYYLQLDVAGNDFATAVTIPLAQEGTSELSRKLTFGDLNKAVNKISSNLFAIASPLSINFEDVNSLEIRVESILGASIAKAYSQPIPLTVKAYFSGLTNDLTISGAALAEDVNITIADGVYKGRLNLTQNAFRFFAKPAETNVSYNYAYFESNGYTIDPLLENANDDKMNFKFTGTEGPWDLVLNTNTKTITLVEVVAPDNLYLIGSLTGWDPATAFPFNNNGDNTFSISANLADGDQFKFIPTNTSWDGAWKQDPNNLGTIINEGGDPNISGYPAGQYLITVNFNSLTFTMKEINNLYLVGSMTNPAWTPEAALPMTNGKAGVFSIVQTLAASDEFKFLPTNTGWDGGIGKDGGNITVPEAGTYVISYNYTNNNISVSKIVIPSQLYLVGSFRGWSNDAGNPQFTQISSNVFQITQALAANDEFKFVKSNTGGDWSNDIAQNKMNPMVIEQNGEDNIKVTTAGDYIITVNFNDGTIKLSK